MARLDALPSIDIIHGFRGILDFYLWKGLPCVRSWPRKGRARLTPATLAAAALFGAIVKGYSLLGAAPKAAFADDATGQPRTARDIYVTAIFGHLHEASMSDFLDLLTEIAGRIQDQLPSYKWPLYLRDVGTVQGNDGYVEFQNADGDTIFVINNIVAADDDRETTRHQYYLRPGAIHYGIGDFVAAFPPGVPSNWTGQVFLEAGDTLLIYFEGSLHGDAVTVFATGHVMTKET